MDKEIKIEIKKSLLGYIEHGFKVPPQNNIIFLCGGAGENSSRSILNDFYKKNIEDFEFIFAEKVFDYPNDFKNILDLENAIAIFSDCIVIILESYGAFAELGAFANHNDLKNKILIINERQFKDVNSFINEGPIRKIISSKDSKFKKVMYCQNLKAILDIAFDLKAVLKEMLPKNRSNMTKEILLQAFENDAEDNYKIRFYFLIKLLAFLVPISRNDFYSVLKNTFGFEKNKLEIVLNFILALGYYKEDNKSGLIIGRLSSITNVSKILFLSGTMEVAIRKQILKLYRKKMPEILKQYDSCLNSEG